jgi:predicted kinase
MTDVKIGTRVERAGAAILKKEKSMTKPICTVMVGLPATGKSTLIEVMYKPDTWIYSTDMYIDTVAEDNGITYNQAFESNIKAATEFNEQKLNSMIKLSKDIIWDQTNLGVSKRRKIINRMKQAGYRVRCVCIVTPEAGHISDLKDWKYRLQNRPGKTIPNEVISNMMENFVIPTIEEGFDMITFYNMYGAFIGCSFE